MNASELKKYMAEVIDNNLDHRNIDKDVPYFKERCSSMENISVYIWDKLKEIMPSSELLYEVKVHENDNNFAYYRGEQH